MLLSLCITAGYIGILGFRSNCYVLIQNGSHGNLQAMQSTFEREIEGMAADMMKLRVEQDVAAAKLKGMQEQVEGLKADMEGMVYDAVRTSSDVSHMPAAMVIVEPRKHKHLKYVLENFHRHIPNHYVLYIFHGKSHGLYAHQSAAIVARHRPVLYVPLEKDSMTPKEYNALLTDPQFWHAIDAEDILIFQTDSILCGASPKCISDFDHLGYIGCAYNGAAGRGTHWEEHAFWGAGGLSFRKKSAALECLSQAHDLFGDPSLGEDVVFSDCVDAGIGERPQGASQLLDFCSQDNFMSLSFGAHRVHDRMHKLQLGRFLAYCPEAVPLLDP